LIFSTEQPKDSMSRVQMSYCAAHKEVYLETAAKVVGCKRGNPRERWSSENKTLQSVDEWKSIKVEKDRLLLTEEN